MPANQAYPAARAAAAAAIERDALVANAHAVLGYAGFGVDWDLVAAEREYRRALEIDPNAVTALVFFGTHLCEFGRPDEADRYLRRATQLDPLSPFTSWIVEWCGYASHRYAARDRDAQEDRSACPGFWYLDSLVGAAHRELGDYPAAIREYEAAASRLGGAPMYGLAITYARIGRMKEAREIVRRLDDLAARRLVPALAPCRRPRGHRRHGRRGRSSAAVRSMRASSCWSGHRGSPNSAALLTDPRARRILEEADAIWMRR